MNKNKLVIFLVAAVGLLSFAIAKVQVQNTFETCFSKMTNPSICKSSNFADVAITKQQVILHDNLQTERQAGALLVGMASQVDGNYRQYQNIIKAQFNSKIKNLDN